MDVTLSTAFGFALTSLLVELTPGPNMAYLAVLSASQGRRTGFAAALGVGLGLLVVGLAAALGLAAVIKSTPFLYQALRWGGVAYLLWLAWEGWQTAAETSPGKAGDMNNPGKYFLRGFASNLLNPKAGIFYIAILPSFVDVAKNIVSQTVALSLIYVAIATTVHVAIVALAGAARPLLSDQRRSQVIRRTFSILLAAIAIWFGFATRQ